MMKLGNWAGLLVIALAAGVAFQGGHPMPPGSGGGGGVTFQGGHPMPPGSGGGGGGIGA